MVIQWNKIINAVSQKTYNYPIVFPKNIFGITGSPNNHPFVNYNDGQIYFLNVSLASFQIQAAFKISNPICFAIAIGN